MATETIPKKEGYLPCPPKPAPIPKEVLEPQTTPDLKPLPA